MDEFKVGDKVVIQRNRNAYGDHVGSEAVGKTVTLLRRDYQICNQDGWQAWDIEEREVTSWVRSDDVTLVETPNFAVGQWVRVLRTDYPGTIDVGAVAKVINAEDHGATLPGHTYGLFFYNEELEPWTPRAGERVRYSDDCVAGIGTVESVDGRHDEDLPIGVFVERKDLDCAYFGPQETVRLFRIRELSPVIDAPARVEAPFQIQAGKFYKTRDGRKVGPLVEDEDDCFPFISHDLSETWRADGTWSLDRQEKHRLDLIAEWTDTPIVTAATVDAINEEYGPVVREAPVAVAKFKVGDRVKHTSLGYVGTVEDVIDAKTVKTYWPSEEWGGCDPIIDLELVIPTPPAIVALITDGKPQPATKPKVHDSQELATKEAERLALANPGQQFGVFVLADSKIADEVVTKTAVLRAA